MKVLVTGGNGFLGSHVVESFAARGVEPRLMLRRTSDVGYLGGLNYERVEGDLRDPEALGRACEGVETVVHLAALVFAPSEARYQEVNAVGTANLVHAARAAGATRFVYVSSLAAQGPNPDRETLMPEPPRPVSAYGRSKLAGEHAVLAAGRDLEAAVLRLSVVYGQRDRALLPFYRMAKHGFVPVYGSGDNLVSWLHVHDAAGALVDAALAEGRSGCIYTVSDGNFYTWRELVVVFGRVWGRTPRVLEVPPWLFQLAGYASGAAQAVSRRPLPLQPDQVRHMRAPYFICGNAAIRRELGWRPAVGLEEGFAQTIAWCREQGLL